MGGLWAVPNSSRAGDGNNNNNDDDDDDDDANPRQKKKKSKHRPTGTHAGFVNPFMRTNLSRFSVGFSDLAWESVFRPRKSKGGGAETGTRTETDEDDEEENVHLSLFPHAWQVRRYLEAYAERYIIVPPGVVLRLGCRVVRAVRREMEMETGTGTGKDGEKARWTVEWIEEDVSDGEGELDEKYVYAYPSVCAGLCIFCMFFFFFVSTLRMLVLITMIL